MSDRLPSLSRADRSRIAVELNIAAGGYDDAGLHDDARECRRLAERAHPDRDWREPPGARPVRLDQLRP